MEQHQNGKLGILTLNDLFELQQIDLKLHALSVRWYTKLLLHTIVNLHPEYNLDEFTQCAIVEAALFHDIGKILIPDDILLKAEELKEDEKNLIHAHPLLGAKLIEFISDDDKEYLRIILDVCRYHHERWDGKGYPYALSKEGIPLSAQIVGLADVYDALTQERCYKEKIEHEQAVQMIRNGECGTFSPALLECLDVCNAELYHALSTHQTKQRNPKFKKLKFGS